MDDFTLYDTVEGMQLEEGDRIVFTDYDDDIHHISIINLDDENTAFVGNGYCQEHDDTCPFKVGAFDLINLWKWAE